MSLLTICEALAKDVGRQVPASIVGATGRDEVEYLDYANRTGKELARRVDWGDLTKSTTLTGTGADATFSLPSDFARLTRHGGVKFGTTPLRPLTRAEWNTTTGIEGTPRYFLLEDASITLRPFMANGATATVIYQSTEWASTGATFTTDAATSLIDEELFTQALIVRFRRQKGMDYADYEAEYEATLRDLAKFDGASRL